MIKQAIGKLSRILYKFTLLGQKTGPHVTRYFMYSHLSKYKEKRKKELKVLSISHSEELATLLGFDLSQITDASYPEFNILSLPFKDNEFDFIVSDQVFEHIEGSPQDAMDEIFRVLKSGGTSLHTTCFINPIHGCPNDYWRFTPDALQLLTQKHGATTDVGGWGNFYVWLLVFAGLRHQPIPNSTWHPAHWIATKNQSNWPIVTWVLTKKS